MSGQANIVALTSAAHEADLLHELVCLWCARAEKREEFNGAARLAALEEHFLERAENWQRVFRCYDYDEYEKRLLLLAYTCDHDALAYARLARLKEAWCLQGEGRVKAFAVALGYSAAERHRYRVALEKQQKEKTVFRVRKEDVLEELYLSVDYDALLPLLTGEHLERQQVLQEEENEQPLSAVVLNHQEQEAVKSFIAQYREVRERAATMRARGITYGTAPTLLLHGMPGTGKTMLARGLATELGVPLLTIRRDARQRVEARGDGHGCFFVAMQEAAARGGLLYIDECDDLFTEGSEASREFLIACEQHAALVVLSTNNSSRLDPALQRRMLVCLEFTLPQAEQRAEIWRRHLQAAGLALTEGVTAEQLGEWYPMPGGYIKNTVLLCRGNGESLHGAARDNLRAFLTAGKYSLNVFVPRPESGKVKLTAVSQARLVKARAIREQYERLTGAGCRDVRPLTIAMIVRPFQRVVTDAALAEVLRGTQRPVLVWRGIRGEKKDDITYDRDMFLMNHSCWTVYRREFPLIAHTRKEIDEYMFCTMHGCSVRFIPVDDVKTIDVNVEGYIDLMLEVEADNTLFTETLDLYGELLELRADEREAALQRFAGENSRYAWNNALGNALTCCKGNDPSLRGLALLDAAIAEIDRRRNLRRPLFGN